MYDPHTLNVWVHIAAGASGLVVGAVPLLTRKGGFAHRRAGKIFVTISAIALSTALIGDIFYDPPAPLIAASLAAGYQYLSSLRALHLRERGPGWIDAALAFAGLGACAALLVFMGPGTPSWTPALGYSIVGAVATVSLYDLSRHLWRDAWLKHARPLDHGLKMTGAYFAMMSAGVGNVFRDFQPWSQVGPSMLGVVVMLVLTSAYLTRGARLKTAAVAAAPSAPSS